MKCIAENVIGFGVLCKTPDKTSFGSYYSSGTIITNGNMTTYSLEITATDDVYFAVDTYTNRVVNLYAFWYEV